MDAGNSSESLYRVIASSRSPSPHPERLAMRTDDLVGTEFDWVAVDQTGAIGIFLTAGYGPVPIDALSRLEDHEDLIDWIGHHAALPSFVGDVPIFGFNWVLHSGPYRRIQQPRGFPPMRLEALPEELRGAVVELDLNFERLEFIAGSAIEQPGEDGTRH